MGYFCDKFHDSSHSEQPNFWQFVNESVGENTSAESEISSCE